MADGAARGGVLHLGGVDAAGGAGQAAARLPQEGGEGLLAPGGQVADRLDAALAQAPPVTSPTPHSLSILSGARKAASPPAGR